MKLTKKLIDGLQYSGNNNSRCIVWDDGLPGFGCRVYPSGKKAFVLSYRLGGRKRMMGLGQFGSITLDHARKMAKKQIASILDGNDPLEKRNQLRMGETIADLCSMYLERHAKIHKKSWQEDERRMKLFILPKFASRKVKDISRPEIANLHRKIGLATPYEANSLLALFSVMFEFAIKHGFREESSGNPAKRISKFPEQKRDRWVTPEELPRLVTAIETEKVIYVRAALWLYLLTGARKSEVLQMQWDNVDLIRKEWRLPMTKAGRPHHIPLSSPALEILANIPRQVDNPYVICGRNPGSHLVNIFKPWCRVRTLAGIEDVRLHDLRRTVGSWLAQNGNSLHLIGRVLNHSNASTTQVYAHFGQDQVRTALDNHAVNLFEALQKEQ